jgi:lipoprotein-releasing system permease protein
MILSAFERLVAIRYLRARRQEGFISIVALFSFIGILLGVGVLIVTMAVFNGFHHDLLSRILGVTSHVTVVAQGVAIEDYDALDREIAKVPGVTQVTPLIEGQIMATANGRGYGALVRGRRTSQSGIPAGRGHGLRHGAADEGLSGGRHYRDRPLRI